MDHQAATAQLLLQDEFRLRCLKAACSLQLPDWYLGAGFLRNAIWDHLHKHQIATPLNDIDLVYFDAEDVSESTEQRYAAALSALVPEVCWEVKNQARMHLRHQHAPYQRCSDGIQYWVEVPTCVAVRLEPDGQLQFYTTFGLAENWSLDIKINPLNPRPALFQQRIQEKGWLQRWPKLRVVGPFANGIAEV